jgi:hypothetical protein
MDYNGGTETIAIFVIRDDRQVSLRKGSIEAFWVGFPVKLHVSLFDECVSTSVLITFHRKVLEYNLGVLYGVPVMTLVT